MRIFAAHYFRMMKSDLTRPAAKKPTKPAAKKLVPVGKPAQKPVHATVAEIRRAVRAVRAVAG
jgi:hypothetical protein